MRCYAVVDTNVLVSAMITNNPHSSTSIVMSALMYGKIVPLYSQDILAEYDKVLHRKKFNLKPESIGKLLNSIVRHGNEIGRTESGEYFPDATDAVFYEVALSKEGAYLVTGNTRHFPVKPIVVTPAEMVAILQAQVL